MRQLGEDIGLVLDRVTELTKFVEGDGERQDACGARGDAFTRKSFVCRSVEQQGDPTDQEIRDCGTEGRFRGERACGDLCETDAVCPDSERCAIKVQDSGAPFEVTVEDSDACPSLKKVTCKVTTVCSCQCRK